MAEEQGGLAEVSEEQVEYGEEDAKNLVGPINRIEGSTAGEVLEEIDTSIEVVIDDDTGEIELNMSDEMEVIMEAQSDHYANLAEYIDDDDLEEISSIVSEHYEADKESRQEWESTFERGFDLLGLKLEEASEPFEGACQAVSPLIIESAVKFQSKATVELFPASGPVKTQIVGDPNEKKQLQANRVQDFMNYQVTEQMPEYFDEFERMLFHLPLMGSAFKKMYFDPVKGRPCSEFVPVDHFYVSYNASDLMSASRYTHVINRSPNDIRKEMTAGLYKECDLGHATTPEPAPISSKINDIMGVNPGEDYDEQYVLLEQHCYIDLPEPFNSPDGSAWPYVVTIEESSGKVLAIRRNWAEGDPLYQKLMYFTHYKFVPGFGFYGLGLIHLLGNLTMSATAALRSLVDAGQFANLPGGFKARGIRIVGNNDPISPGEFREIDAAGMDINKAIVPLPYKDPSNTLYQLLGTMTEMGQKFADNAEAIVANSTNYGPVGTTLALLEAGAKFFSAIHKRLHQSQKHEFRILARINRDFLPPTYPYMVPGMSASILRDDFNDEVDVIPVSDPNTPSAAHRLAMAQMVLQLSEQAPPGMYDVRQVHMSILNAANIQNPQRFITPPQEAQPQSPIENIQSAINGMPIKAFPQQDHQAYIQIFTDFIADPMLGGNEMMKNVVPVLQAAIREHMFLQYKEQMEGLVQLGAQEGMQAGVNTNDPAILNQISISAAKKVLVANEQRAAQMGGAENVQEQSLAIEAERVGIQKDELRLKASEQAAELALKNRKLDLEEMEIRQQGVNDEVKAEERNVDRRLRAAKDSATIASKVETNKTSEDTKIVIETLRNLQKVAEEEMKEADITEERLGMIVDSLIREQGSPEDVEFFEEGGPVLGNIEDDEVELRGIRRGLSMVSPTAGDLKRDATVADAMKEEDTDSLVRKKLDKYEGVRSSEYKDSKGKSTLAKGHLVTSETPKILENLGYSSDEVSKILAGQMNMSSEKIEELFNIDLKNKTEQAKKLIKNYDSLSPDLQSELIQLNYRGDLVQSPTTRRLINEGKFKEAAEELLNHEEYKALKAQNIDNSITRRLEAARDALLKEADK